MSVATIKKPVMRYHGAKFRLAPWVISHFPDHETYVEPFGGAAGVLMQKERSYSEIYNDLDGDIVNVFRVLQDPEKSKQLVRSIQLTPYAREEFDSAYTESDCEIDRARKTIIRAQMGFGSAGTTKQKTGFRIDSARKYGTSCHLWDEYPQAIGSFCERLKGVVIENRDALEVCKNHDRESTLFYLDPPYVHSTRKMKASTRCYRHELTDSQHELLLKEIKELRGMVIVSGYESDLYQDILSDWKSFSSKSQISAGRGTATRTETIWLNDSAYKGTKQKTLI